MTGRSKPKVMITKRAAKQRGNRAQKPDLRALKNARTPQAILERRRRAEQSFVEALKRADAKMHADAVNDLSYDWRPRFLRSLAELPPISDQARALMLSMWVRWGDSWRSEVDNDLLLIDVLRNLLPPYTGEDVQLFRGESAFSRRRRTYGMSWTIDRRKQPRQLRRWDRVAGDCRPQRGDYLHAARAR